MFIQKDSAALSREHIDNEHDDKSRLCRLGALLSLVRTPPSAYHVRSHQLGRDPYGDRADFQQRPMEGQRVHEHGPVRRDGRPAAARRQYFVRCASECSISVCLMFLTFVFKDTYTEIPIPETNVASELWTHCHWSPKVVSKAAGPQLLAATIMCGVFMVIFIDKVYCLNR